MDHVICSAIPDTTMTLHTSPQKEPLSLKVLLSLIVAVTTTGSMFMVGSILLETVEVHDYQFLMQDDPSASSVSMTTTTMVVASKRGKKYYPVGSAGEENLAPDNRIYFSDAASAERAGYSR